MSSNALTLANIPLDIPLTYNFRSLGHYPTISGNVTKEHYYRSDSLSKVSSIGWQAMESLRIKTIVDLRSSIEIQKDPTPMTYSFQTVSISLLDDMASNGFTHSSCSSLSSVYIGLLESQKDKLSDIFKLLAEEKDPIVFHCTAGKDRTGVIAMLLLDLAQVKEEHILADYSVSAEYMQIPFQKIRAMQPQADDMFFESPVLEMIKTRDWLKHHFCDAQGYLKNGLKLSNQDILAIQKNLFD
ncbi:tyrosine-protein phosphatase [Faecalicoccus acidiformans]|uniref:tyrosine-protein phosphatase n=1 Tax=Faecalicoccus acidiformans TaxID=915173 RepID=UPI0025A3AF03|nr:tyrosine-protein phosphatase [Faecalicoccus acidiformans]MDM8203578.1 tyrosine-protein phosphatase [Faecalicoccus acidiformans]